MARTSIVVCGVSEYGKFVRRSGRHLIAFSEANLRRVLPRLIKELIRDALAAIGNIPLRPWSDQKAVRPVLGNHVPGEKSTVRAAPASTLGYPQMA
jgi:hypothetical protein